MAQQVKLQFTRLTSHIMLLVHVPVPWLPNQLFTNTSTWGYTAQAQCFPHWRPSLSSGLLALVCPGHLGSEPMEGRYSYSRSLLTLARALSLTQFLSSSLSVRNPDPSPARFFLPWNYCNFTLPVAHNTILQLQQSCN